MRARWMVWLLALVAFSCTKTVKLSPELQKKFDRATSLVRSDDKNVFPEAERLFGEIIAAEPKFDDAVYWKAQMLIAWADALLQEAVVLEAAEKELDELAGKAEAKAEQADTPEAQAFAQVLVTSIRERHAKVAGTLGQWREDAAEHKARALEMVKNEIRDEPDAPYQAHRILADYYRVKGDTERARKELDIVRELKPDSAGLAFVEGVMSLTLDNDPDAAVAAMDRALAKDDNFVKALYTKGLALAKKGDKKAAEEVMQAVLTKSANHLGAKTYLHTASIVQQATDDLELEELPQK